MKNFFKKGIGVLLIVLSIRMITPKRLDIALIAIIFFIAGFYILGAWQELYRQIKESDGENYKR